MIDARVNTSLPSHPKTKKLARRLGPSGPLGCIYLFLWAAANRSDGDLTGMTDEDIELAVDWQGEEGQFVGTMVDVGFIDGQEKARVIHDWAEHNPWAAGAEARSERSKWAALCKRHGRKEAALQMPEYAAKLEESAGSMPVAVPESAASILVAESGSAPSPFLSVSDTDTVSKEQSTDVDRLSAVAAPSIKPPRKTAPSCPHMEIIGLYHEILPELPEVRVWESDRQAHLRQRWLSHPDRQSLEWWREYFTSVRSMPWLMGQKPGRDGQPFVCNLEWLVKQKNFGKVIEGNYARGW